MSDIILKTIAEIPMRCSNCSIEHKISYEILNASGNKELIFKMECPNCNVEIRNELKLASC